MQCTSHLKQIGLAVHNFHDTHMGLPPLCLLSRTNSNMQRPTMWVLIYPFLEQATLYDMYQSYQTGSGSTLKRGFQNNFSNVWWNGLTDAERMSHGAVSTYKCPTRRGSAYNIFYDPVIATNANDCVEDQRQGGPLSDYAVVQVKMTNPDDSVTDNGRRWWDCHHTQSDSTSAYDKQQWFPGPIRACITKRTAEPETWECRDTMAWWQDGTSNQFLAGEKHIPEGGLALPNTQYGDFPYHCTGNHRSVGPGRVMVKYYITPSDHTTVPLAKERIKIGSTEMIHEETYGLFGSWHPGVCNFVLGDGSVRSISVACGKQTLMSYSVVYDGTSAELP